MDNGKLVKVEMMPREGELMFTQEHLDRLRMLACTPGAIERLLQCAERIPYIESCMSRVEGQCRTVTQRCDASDLMFQQYLCPGQVNFSQRTLDEYSDDSQVNLEDVVTGLGGDIADAGHRTRTFPRIAYMPQGLGRNLYPTLSVFENVDFFGRLFGHAKRERERRIGDLLRGNADHSEFRGYVFALLFYKRIPISVAFIRGTTADAEAGPPWTDITRSLRMRFPGVRPPPNVSNSRK